MSSIKMKKIEHATSAEIRRLRLSAGLTQTEAAGLIHCHLRTFQQYEATEGTQAHRQMHPAFFELFRLKIRQLTQ